MVKKFNQESSEAPRSHLINSVGTRSYQLEWDLRLDAKVKLVFMRRPLLLASVHVLN